MPHKMIYVCKKAAGTTDLFCLKHAVEFLGNVVSYEMIRVETDLNLRYCDICDSDKTINITCPSCKHEHKIEKKSL